MKILYVLRYLNTGEYEDLQAKKSGWTLNEIYGLQVDLNKYMPLKSGTYIPLPESVRKTKSIINIQNGDNRCFYYCMYAKYLSSKVAYQQNRYNNIEAYTMKKTEGKVKFNWTNIEFPTSISHVKKFENQNPSVSINIFGLDEEGKVYPIKISTEKENHYDLLYLVNNKTSHYCYISNFEGLVKPQLTKHTEAISVCKRC